MPSTGSSRWRCHSGRVSRWPSLGEADCDPTRASPPDAARLRRQGAVARSSRPRRWTELALNLTAAHPGEHLAHPAELLTRGRPPRAVAATRVARARTRSAASRAIRKRRRAQLGGRPLAGERRSGAKPSVVRSPRGVMLAIMVRDDARSAGVHTARGSDQLVELGQPRLPDGFSPREAPTLRSLVGRR